MKIRFNNPRIGQIKSVKLGGSWSLFLSGGLIGLPLFLRGLCIWGAVMASLWALGFIIPDGVGTLIVSAIGIGLSIFLDLKRNEMLAKNYLKYGWKFVDPPENDIEKTAKKHWGIRTE